MTKKSRKIAAINILAIILGCLEIGLFSGIIFGWSSLVYVYKDVGYFADMCDVMGALPLHGNSSDQTPTISNASTASAVVFTTTTTLTNVTSRTIDVEVRLSELSFQKQMDVRSRDEGAGQILCDSQDEQFNLIFSIAIGVTGVLCFPNGLMYDRMGTRFTRIVSLITFCAGAVLLIFASPSKPYLLYLGFLCLVYGGYLLQVINLPLAALVPRYRSTIMTILSGSFDSSSFIFVLFKFAYEAGFSINACFVVQVVIFFILVASTTFFLFPTHWLANPLPDGFRLRCRLCGFFRRNQKYSVGEDEEPSKVSTGMSDISICSSTGSSEADSRKNNTGQPFGRNSGTLDSGNGRTEEMFKRRNKLGTCNTGFVNEVEFEIVAKEDNGHSYNGKTDNGPSSKGVSFKDQTHDEMLSDAPSSKTVSSKEQSLNGLSSNEHTNSGLSFKDTSDGLSVKDHTSNKLSFEEQATNDLSLKDLTPNERSLKGESVLSANPSPLDEKTHAAENMTFRQVLCSPLFWTHLVWFSSQRFRNWIFVGVFNPWITRLACGDTSIVSHYTSVYAYIQFAGVLFAPWSGRLMDRKIKGTTEKYGHPRYERIHAAIANFALDTTIAVLLTVGTLIPVMQAQYVTFVLHLLHRSFLYGPNAAFVANAFPQEHFGKVLGATLTVSAIIGFLQYPCFLIVYGPLNGDPFWIYIWRYLQQTASQRTAQLAKGKCNNGHESMNF